jgi:hypothetical protein
MGREGGFQRAWGGSQAQPSCPCAVRSGQHFDAKIFPQLFQKHKSKHSVGDETEGGGKEALGGDTGDGDVESPEGHGPTARNTSSLPPHHTLKKASGPTFAVSMAQWRTPCKRRRWVMRVFTEGCEDNGYD